MVIVKGSTGLSVSIDMLGIAEVMRRLQAAGEEIKQGADFGVVRAGAWVEEELKESIAGHRAEPRSVRTALFANSIEFDKISDAVGVVKSDPRTYPGTSITTEDVAGFLEKDRQHFTNTRMRTETQVTEIIEEEIKRHLT